MNAVDDSKDSCWAVDPQFGKDHAAIFDFETPIGYESGTSLEITLRFNCNKQHGIGRARFALTTREDPPIEGTPVPEVASRVLAALDADPSVSLTAEQTSALLTWFRPHDPQWQRLRTRVKDHEANAPKQKLAKVLVSSEGVPAVRLHTQGLDFYDPTHHLKRGDPNQKGEVASQGFLNVLVRSADLEKRWQEAPPAEWRTSYRRRALSNWLVDVDQGAGQLLARVIVNRVWYYHMGRGIVTTPSDFGKQGERPSHPELLDWLATEFIKGGWRLKHLHQLIMTSAVYMQTNATDDARLAADRDNVLFWHWNGRRLEAEVIRDSMLATAGQLDRTMFGPGTLDQKHRRRSIYFFVKRSQLVPMMTLFDGPDTLQDLPCRVSTTIAPQALMLMNNTVVRENAAGLLARIRSAGADRDTVIRNAFLHALSRYPGEDERAAADAFLSSQSIAYEQDGQANASELAWIDFCQALLCLNEYVYID
jgi:hypothetical protein